MAPLYCTPYNVHNFFPGACWHCRSRQGTIYCKSRARGFLGDLLQAGLVLHQAGALRSIATGFQGTGGEIPDCLECIGFTRDCFEDELVPVFASVGRIYELRLMIEFSGTNRTYCYVRYSLFSGGSVSKKASKLQEINYWSSGTAMKMTPRMQ